MSKDFKTTKQALIKIGQTTGGNDYFITKLYAINNGNFDLDKIPSTVGYYDFLIDDWIVGIQEETGATGGDVYIGIPADYSQDSVTAYIKGYKSMSTQYPTITSPASPNNREIEFNDISNYKGEDIVVTIGVPENSSTTIEQLDTHHNEMVKVSVNKKSEIEYFPNGQKYKSIHEITLTPQGDEWQYVIYIMNRNMN